MLTRQKILLRMLQAASRPVLPIELMRWCFLLRQESETKGGSACYDFVPYNDGPFSFALDQEIHKLESMGHVISLADRSWRAATGAASVITNIPPLVERDILKLVRDFGAHSAEQLRDFVYRSYPAWTINSARQKLAPRLKSDVAVYTAGYENLSIDAFLNLLVESGIERLIDVRSNPTARRFGFHKSTLTRLLNSLGIEYRHFAELGIPSEIRKSFPTEEDRKHMFDEYEVTTLAKETDTVNAVAHLMCERPSVLVCMEADPNRCHRNRLARPVSELTGLPIVHLVGNVAG